MAATKQNYDGSVLTTSYIPPTYLMSVILCYSLHLNLSIALPIKICFKMNVTYTFQRRITILRPLID